MKKDIGFLGTPWSISGVVRRELRSWKKNNDLLKKWKISWFAQEIQAHGERPGRFVVLTLFLFFLLTTFSFCLPKTWVCEAGIILHLKEDADYLTYFTALWSIQATLAALVYPFVISFVTVFLQRRPAAEAFVHIYILDSGGLVAGLSSITLVIVMAVQYAAIPRYGISLIQHMAALDAMWFSVNALLTLYFLYRTVEFLRPIIQVQAITRFLIGSALPREIQRGIAPHVLDQAPANGWLPIPVPDLRNPERQTGPEIWIGRHIYRKGESQGHLLLKRPSKLVDVRLWPLRLVTKHWLSKAEKWPSMKPKFGETGRKPMLSISLSPEAIYDGDVELAAVADGPEIKFLQRYLLRLVFAFRAERREQNSVSLHAIIHELEIDVCSSVASQNEQHFRKSYETLLQIHELLLGACLLRNDDGRSDSFAMLPDREHWAQQRLYASWTEAYRSIFQAAVENIDKDLTALKRVCYFVQHIGGDAVRSSPVEIQENILMMPTHLMFLISGWWAKRIEEQGLLLHNAHSGKILRAPAHRTYEEIFISFVGAWENARKAVGGFPNQNKQIAWGNGSTLVQLNALHIRETARMLLAAVERGDRIAAEWFADVLAKWWGDFSYERAPHSLYRIAVSFTLEDAYLDWDLLRDEFKLEDRDGTPQLQRAVLLASLRNYLQDIQLITLEILLQWCSQSTFDNFDQSLAMDIAANMLRGKQWRSGGTQSDPLNRLTAAAYLRAKTRQHVGGLDARRTYEARLNDFIEKINDMDRPGMTGSRVYSYGGPVSLDSLRESQLVLMMLLSDSAWSPDEEFRRQLDFWSKQKYIERGDFHKARDVLNQWLQKLENESPIMPDVLSELLERLGKQSGGEARLRDVKKALSEVKRACEVRYSELLAAASIDPKKLTRAEMISSAMAFDKRLNRFPLSLFRNVIYSEEAQEEFTLRINNIRKGELTTTAFEQSAINENEYLSETVANQVDIVLLHDVLSKCQLLDIAATDSASYWQAVVAEAKRMSDQGLNPILLLNNPTEPPWVWDWQNAFSEDQISKPVDLNVRKEMGHTAHYQCHFNEIAVYACQISPSTSLVVPREIFDTVTFRQFFQNRYVEASVETYENDQMAVSLLLKFERNVHVANSVGLRIRYVDSTVQENQ